MNHHLRGFANIVLLVALPLEAAECLVSDSYNVSMEGH